MNQEQIKSLIRSFGQTFGPMIGVYLAARHVLPADQVTAIFTSEVFIGILTSIVLAVWGLFVHSKTNAVAVVDAMPEVAGVVTQPTVAGRDLAQAVPSPTVAVAGTTSAAAVAAK